ncbi:MAG: 16S rRNA (guanine(966)-N(2))-methyltransferase RsmD [Proteobacteria bacterium]|nr:16S rRNA (guanine(966)-N(2))-methyltransferase RsmD [Pseudomonadota bacterium]
MPREVRIIGGQWKRSKLPVADKPGLRPTPDRVRETLFNWLGGELDGWRVLDAFAGSGALGFEAASRGAAEVLLLERDRALAAGLNQSRERLKADTLRVQCADALAWMAACAPRRFELVFLDPPFDAGLFDKALAAAARVAVPDGFVYLEADREFTAAELAPLGLAVHRHLRAGQVHAHLLRVAINSAATRISEGQL